MQSSMYINSIAAIRTFGLGMGGSRTLHLIGPDGQTSSVSLQDPSQDQTTDDNKLAYRAAYTGDLHQSGLGSIFVNVREVFSCYKESSASGERAPICTIFTHEDDGFRNGKPWLQLGEIGNDVRVFSASENIPTYGLAVQGCPQLNEECLPTKMEIKVVCFLDPIICPNTAKVNRYNGPWIRNSKNAGHD